MEIINAAELPESVQSAGTRISENRVIVRLYPHSLEEEARFLREVTSSPSIVFEALLEPVRSWGIPAGQSERSMYDDIDNADFYPLSMPTIFPGMNIGGFVPFSAGFRVVSRMREGFITAAHAVSPGQIMPGNIGIVAEWQNSGSIDAAFVNTAGRSQTSNQVFGTSAQLGNSVFTSFRQGEILAKMGARTQLTTGIVEQPNHTHRPTDGGVTLSGVVLTNLLGGRGDSGGPVFSTNGTMVAGIVTGGEGEESRTLVFTRADFILNAFMAFRR
jgi:hypothetical protein